MLRLTRLTLPCPPVVQPQLHESSRVPNLRRLLCLLVEFGPKLPNRRSGKPPSSEPLHVYRVRVHRFTSL